MSGCEPIRPTYPYRLSCIAYNTCKQHISGNGRKPPDGPQLSYTCAKRVCVYTKQTCTSRIGSAVVVWWPSHEHERLFLFGFADANATDFTFTLAHSDWERRGRSYFYICICTCRYCVYLCAFIRISSMNAKIIQFNIAIDN